MVTIELQHEITTHAGPTKQLQLRDAVASDYTEINKLPFSLTQSDAGNKVDIDFKVALRWLARLSGVDEILLSKMHRRDFMGAVGQLNEYLMAEEAAPGNSPS